MRPAVAISGAILATLFFATASLADAAEIVVRVVDDATSEVVRGARVTVIGTGPGEVRTGVAGADGSVQVQGFGPGSIRLIVSASGYPDVYRSTFDLPDRLSASFEVTVRLNRLMRIGGTSARTDVPPTQRSIGEGTPLRRISSDLVDALSRLGGVSVAGDGTTFRIGLRGRDPAETSFMLNGTPVGVNAAQLAIDSDLLEEAQVDSARETVAFSLLAPTVAAIQKLDTAAGGYGTSFVRSTAQGTSGNVGYAAAHVERGAESALNGRVYDDLSGSRYRHVGSVVKIGDYAKLSAPLGYWSLSASEAVSRSAGSPLAAYLAGDLPAGIGPGERKVTNAQNAIIVANGTLRGLALSFNASMWSYRGYDDQSTRTIFGVPAPLILGDATSGRSVQAYLSTTFGDSRTLEILGTVSWTRTLASWGPVTQGSSEAAAVERSFKATERLKLDGGRSIVASATVTSNASGTLPTFHLEERRRRGNTDGALAIDYGRKPVRSDSPENVRTLLDSRSASYDCDGHVVTAYTPGDADAQPTVLGVNASFSTRSKRAHLQASAYFEQQRNLLLTGASVRAGDGQLGSFVNDLINGYRTFGGCSGTISADDVVFIRNVVGASVRYDGIELSGGTGLGRHWLLEGDFALQQAVATKLPPVLTASRSYYAVGRQLPNIPYWNGTLSLDWRSNDERTEAVLNATMTSLNNSKNLPAVSVWSAAIQHRISPALVLTVVGTNVTKAYTGDFVSPRYALPYLLENGSLQPALAAPEPPPRLFFSLSYRNR
jgi:carboxypeptidase family protein